MKELNFFKIIMALNLAVVFFLLMLLLLIPSHTYLASIYAWFFAGFCFFFLLDLVMFDFPYSELIDTITAEENDEKYPLQMLGLDLKQCFVVSIVAGLLLAGFYGYMILILRIPFMPIPTLFSAPVTPFSSIVSGQFVDIVETTWMVATVEESMWTGLMMPILWSLLFILFLRFSSEHKSAFFASLIIASLLTGAIVPYTYHIFAYGGNLYAYSTAQIHFTASSLLAGSTGCLAGSILAHAIHNLIGKLSLQVGTFEVVPLQAYVAGHSGDGD